MSLNWKLKVVSHSVSLVCATEDFVCMFRHQVGYTHRAWQALAMQSDIVSGG